MPGLDISGTVSYTHLDVYKRQVEESVIVVNQDVQMHIVLQVY